MPTTKPEVTVCTKCVHFLNLAPDSNSPHKDMWYFHLCMATPLPIDIDPYDGKGKPYCRNDIGSKVFTENKFQYCRDVNNGMCPKFQALF
ncbi:MAG: hypothetical protein HY602_02545 [Parcubacteria group bacterium]|nr:hypothetical protein [Parcubacteria group bacterium]